MTVRRRRQSTGPGTAILLALFGGLVLVGATWWWLRSDGESTEPVAQPTVAQEAPSNAASEVERLELPALSASDALVRELAQALSAHPTLASWLVSDELARRFVGVVVDLAGGLSPNSRIPFLIPEEEFQVGDSGEAMLLDPAGYRRYDLFAEVVSSLDTRGTAQLYLELYPLFQEAYEELGIPDGDFASTMALAVENVVSADVPTGTPEIQPNEAIYEFRDIELEALSPVEKHLIRMGPENADAVQGKVDEIWRAIVAGGQPNARP